MDKRIFSFPPIVDHNSRVLILGTMPGRESLRKVEYYAHQRNTFWPIMYSLFNRQYTENYEEKQRLLLENGVALWDVLKACERTSSLDSDILVEEPNDFVSFFDRYPLIETIFFNGQPAARFFKKYVSSGEKNCMVLPSTSPAHAVNIEHKLLKWRAVTETLFPLR